MFVFNCKVKKDEVLKYPKDTFEPETTSKKKNRRSKKKNAKQEEVDKIEPANEIEKEIEYDYFNPVVCEVCGVEIGVYEEKDELYHFFNILASHA